MTKVIKNTHRLNQPFVAYATKCCRIVPHILGDLSLFLPASVRNAREKLRQMFFNYFHFAHHDVGQAFVTALVWARQFQVIQTGGLQQRGVQIVNPHRILHRLVTEIVGRAMRERAASPRCQRCSPKARFSTDAIPARKAPRLESSRSPCCRDSSPRRHHYPDTPTGDSQNRETIEFGMRVALHRFVAEAMDHAPRIVESGVKVSILRRLEE